MFIIGCGGGFIGHNDEVVLRKLQAQMFQTRIEALQYLDTEHAFKYSMFPIKILEIRVEVVDEYEV